MWLNESHRQWHLIGGIILGFFLGIISSVVAGVSMEIKDMQYNDWSYSAWDWKDFWATVLGGFIGNAVSGLIVLTIILC